MPTPEDIRWFKTTFGARVQAAVAGTPLTLDFLAALASQETGDIWPRLRRAGLPTERILALCVGDTLDADKGRKAFPRTKADLVAAPRGQAMFDIARAALVAMAGHHPAYRFVFGKPNKFAHGFGMFQRDLQFFVQDPDYFLERRYEHFEHTLAEALAELRRALKKLGLERRDTLGDDELAAVGIVYNTGRFDPARGLQQGHHNGSEFYGEALARLLRLAHTVAVEGQAPLIEPPAPGRAALRPPTPVTDAGVPMRVRITGAQLRVRAEPVITEPGDLNVKGHLPDGHAVRALSQRATNGFLEIETSLDGALLRGFSSRKFLVPAEAGAAVEVAVPAAAPGGPPAVHAPVRPGVVARRRDPATALSLNEARQPGRSGSTALELCDELAAIADWLDVENPAHARYQPRDGLTFCNIYAHDYCHLAGVFLPRVWWTERAVFDLGRGVAVQPRLGATLVEKNANALFAWLRDFGLQFGWRRTGTPGKLQAEVNQGAVGVIVALRKESNRPGHISVVVPERGDERARRDAEGEVLLPLQSQAGARNLRIGTGPKAWWREPQFADFAFWVHA